MCDEIFSVNRILLLTAFACSHVPLAAAAAAQPAVAGLEFLRVSGNRRFLQTAGGAPFFWLGDTGWLMFQNLDRAGTERYLDDRRSKGFNVIQAMVLHAAGDKIANGAAALVEGDPARPRVTPGNDPSNPAEYDYWDHIDWVIDRAADRGIYIGMVACWGSIVQRGTLTAQNVAAYTRFLAGRYRDKTNIVWITGGDTRGDRNTEVWRIMGRTFKELDPKHLVTYHPFGRTQSATWFHDEPWLDFNMFQSGHRRYDQDTEPQAKGEDNWKYVREDYDRKPVKPTLDGEPSYEDLPQGLHDTTQPYWTDKDVRRYAWWSVFAGAFGHTYGHNAVMQMHKPGMKGSFGPKNFWWEAIKAPGSAQMQFLKNLILSRPFFDRVPGQDLIDGTNGDRYDYVVATRGAGYAMAYTYTGRPFKIRMGMIGGNSVRAWWFDPRSGVARQIGTFPNQGAREFVPPGQPAPGNDWVLVLDDAAKGYGAPGASVAR